MSSSLESMLALIEADVPERVISPHAFAALKSICRLLPTEISSGIGFESRLAEKPAGVDLVVRSPVPRGLDILAGNNQSCRLPDHFFDDVSWERLRSLALDFQTWPEELRCAVPAAWLGFDADQFSSVVSRPSPGLLYLLVGKSHGSRELCDKIARAAYARVKNRPIHRELSAALDTCLDRLPDHAHVRYVGMGISRPTEAVRLVLADLTPGDMLNYLSSIEWPGDLRELELLFLDVDRYTQQITLGIDILTSVQPKIAIEFYLGLEECSGIDPSWIDFLDFARGKDWCLPEKSEGLLQWPGRNLFLAGKDSWPWVVERFLNHVKINYDPASGVQVKAYFGLVWRMASETGAAPDVISRSRKRARSNESPSVVSHFDDSRLSDCLIGAGHFLCENQLDHGEFRSYLAKDKAMRGPCELESSPFVTTFVLYALDILDDPGLSGMKRTAQEFLIREMKPPGLWRYWTSRNSPLIDPDLDVTACASFALRHVHPDIQAKRNIDVILGNRNRDGLFFTWLPSPGSGYNDVDSVVNANVILYLGEREETGAVCRHLNTIIAENREAESYVYYLDDFALYYGVSRAYVNGVRSLGDSRDTVISRITARRQEDGSFGNELFTALAICSLLNYYCQDLDLINPAVSYIIDSQAPDGSWPKRAFYGGPRRPPHTSWFGSEELTTALCIEALAQHRRWLRP